MRFSREFKVGLFAIITIGIFYVGFDFLKGIEFFSPTKKYLVIYNDVAGLQVSNPVQINGFSVGRVSKIDILQDRDHRILVQIEINENINLGDSTVAFLDIDLLGSVSIILEVGTVLQPLEDGDTLQARLDKALEDLLKESALPVADNLQVTIRRINTILDGLSGTSELITGTMANLQDATLNIKRLTAQDNREKFAELLDNMNTSSVSLNQTITKLGAMLENYSDLADSLKTVDLKATLEKTNETLDNISSTMELIREGEGTLGRLMTDDSLYVNLNQTLQDLDKVLLHLNENPKHFFGPLGKSRKKIQRDLNKEN